jgi:hypothetical protein
MGHARTCQERHPPLVSNGETPDRVMLAARVVEHKEALGGYATTVSGFRSFKNKTIAPAAIASQSAPSHN